MIGADVAGWGPGQVMPVTQLKGGSQVTGSLMPAWRSRELARWCRKRAIGSGRVKTNSA